ncbi:MAG TPA: T9SS type A sorting domain-containing protein [Bacteroidia bacterium]|nr:T9SS type A sorting domain-containing protein [Bacteroidia bacterium]
MPNICGITEYTTTKLYIVGGSGYPFQFDNPGGGAWFENTLGGATDIPCISEFDLTATVEGINNISTPDVDINVYPNPALNSFTVQMNLKERENVEFTLYNSLGQLVYTKNLSKQWGMINEKIDVTSLAEGIYLLKVNAGNEFYTKKIIKQN